MIESYMMKSLKITSAIALSLACQFVCAQVSLPTNDASTSALVDVCKNSSEPDAQNFCFGFGEGVYQSYLANAAPNARQSICFSQAGDTREMILQEFIAWTRTHPQFDQERAAKTLKRFLKQRYPCK
jgi:Rap1a immunity proteins